MPRFRFVKRTTMVNGADAKSDSRKHNVCFAFGRGLS